MAFSQTKTANQVEAQLSRFEELDFEAFNKQNGELINQIHVENEDMKAMFALSVKDITF